MESFLRDWRQDALNKAQYESAIFIGDKLLALTDDDKDAFWLAQVHFAMGNYTRAQALLSKSNLISRNASCRYLAAHCLIKQARFDDALAVLGERNPTHLIPSSANKRKAPVGSGGSSDHRLGNKGSTASVSSGGNAGGGTSGSNYATGNGRKTAHGTAAAGGKAAAAAAVRSHAGNRPAASFGRGMENFTEAELAAAAAAAAEASNRRYEAGMCYLRGICYAKQNVFDRAKECYKDAVRIDVQCFEAFQQLTKNQLMAPDEEWEFLQSLNFESIALGGDGDGHGTVAGSNDVAQEAADFTRMLYSTQLSKYRRPEAFEAAAESLASHYRLGNNADLLLARADLAYTQCRYEDALALTSAVLEEDRYNFGAYPLHLACLFEMRMQNVLFLVAHDLADQHPEEPCTWLAVGIYYFATDRIAEARRYFSKASMMDAHYGPAWIGFAHTFAAEGEHDQAISAYSTAARLFTGTHLPHVFLGMQHHAMNNMGVAEEFLKTAYGLCREDPLLLNEMGVVCYHQDRANDAATLFRKALDVSEAMDCDPQAWLSARVNLGHAYRRMRRFSEALAQFDEVLRLGGKNASVFCAKALIQLERHRPDVAAVVLHEALAIRPQDPIATELLSKALAEMALSRNVLQVGPSHEDNGLGGNFSGGGGGSNGGGENDIVDSMDDDEEVGDDDGDGDMDADAVDRFEQTLLQRRLAARQRLVNMLNDTSTVGGGDGEGDGGLRASRRRGRGKVPRNYGSGADGSNGMPQSQLRVMLNPFMEQLRRRVAESGDVRGGEDIYSRGLWATLAGEQRRTGGQTGGQAGGTEVEEEGRGGGNAT